MTNTHDRSEFVFNFICQKHTYAHTRAKPVCASFCQKHTHSHAFTHTYIHPHTHILTHSHAHNTELENNSTLDYCMYRFFSVFRVFAFEWLFCRSSSNFLNGFFRSVLLRLLEGALLASSTRELVSRLGGIGNPQ